MLRRCLSVALLFALVPTLSNADEEKNFENRDAVYQFLQDNVIGRTLAYEYEGNIADDSVFTTFSRKKTFTDLRRTKRGLSFKVFYVIEQKNWDLDSDGQKSDEANPHKKKRVLSEQTAVAQRRSTNEVIGITTVDGNSLADNTGDAYSVRMSLVELEDGTPSLKIERKTVLYSDHFATADSFRPGISETVELLYLKGKKLQADYKYVTQKVDPVSLAAAADSEPRTEKSKEREVE